MRRYLMMILMLSMINPAGAIAPKTPALATVYPCNPKMVSCGCGRSPVRIIPSGTPGSQAAVASSWNMIASLRVNGFNQHVCGGSILNNYFILTAAHCVATSPRQTPTGVTVRVALYTLSEAAPQLTEVDEIFPHPKYIGSSDGYQNDIAILHLSESLDIETDPFIKRTCVPRPNATMNMLQYPANGARLAMMGWPMKDVGTKNMSDALQQAEVFAIDSDHPTCKVLIKDKATQFCAAMSFGDQGYSGGPILQWKGKWWEQVGITSYRNAITTTSQPTVYTRLVNYVDWMEAVINESLVMSTPKPPVTNPPVTYTCNKSRSCGCGHSNVALPSSRIIGGYDAVPYSWTMIVSLRSLESSLHFCGGSILSESFILTAAHCVEEYTDAAMKDVVVVAGVHQQSEAAQIIRAVDRIYLHPEWIKRDYGMWNDIAILHLSEPLDLSTNPYLTRTCIPRFDAPTNMANYPLIGTRLAAVGWGDLDAQLAGSPPNELQQTEIIIVSKEDPACSPIIKDQPRQFCTRVDEGAKAVCRGDSGGPIFEWKGDRWEQVGIVSYGKRCGSEGYADVQAQVANYADWIDHITKGPSTTTATPTSSPTTSTSSSACTMRVSIFIMLLWVICRETFKATF